MRLRRTLISLLAFAAAVVPLGTVASVASAGTPCDAMSSPIYERLNPTSGAQLVTAWQTESDGAAATFGFTQDLGSPVAVSTTSKSGLAAVHRLYRSATRDFLYTTSGNEIASAVGTWGYRDQGVVFYADEQSDACSVPVFRYQLGVLHRLVVEADRDAIEAAGWRYETVAFFATPLDEVPPPPSSTTSSSTTSTVAPPTTPSPTTTTNPTPPSDTTFSFAVMPDTQNETYAGEQRMQQRVAWLIGQRGALDLRWVLHSGDVHNWDTPDHSQFVAMSGWLQPLTTAGIPLVLTVGNHDTAAVCPGGSACPGADASVAVRNTSTWNTFYTPQRFGFEGLFEVGKSDNGWRTIDAGGKRWLLLSLELWPRTEVIQWARSVIAGHPDDNVIVVTHSFLESDGQVSTSNGGYGANSPATLWNALDDYPNVQMIFSGHVGEAANTTLTAADGHHVLAFLQCFHDPTRNPTRIVTVDTAASRVTTSIVANWDRTTNSAAPYEYTQYSATFGGLRLVG